MTVGLKILGAHGAVQIDENYANLLLLSKATVTLTGSYGNSGCEYVDVALTGCTSTVLALRCNYHCTCFLMTKSGTTWTYRIVVAPDSGGSLPSGATVTYYRFETKVPPSSDTIGFRIRKNGEVLFDHGYMPLRVTDFIRSADVLANPDQNTYTSGRTYAHIIVRQGANIVEVPSGPTGQKFVLWMFGSAKSITNGIEVGRGVYFQSTLNLSDPTPVHPVAVTDILVADVTNF